MIRKYNIEEDRQQAFQHKETFNQLSSLQQMLSKATLSLPAILLDIFATEFCSAKNCMQVQI